ncbi:MAG: hypothetical protein K2O43_03585, partial [Muribaculaceae bacterium]|nr:hypothetical protein [Muribaculaceae bacterium]
PKTSANARQNEEDNENNEDDEWDTDFIPGSQYNDAHKNGQGNTNNFNRNTNNSNRNTLSNRR